MLNRITTRRYTKLVKLSEPTYSDEPPKDYKELSDCYSCDLQAIWNGEYLEGFEARRCQQHE